MCETFARIIGIIALMIERRSRLMFSYYNNNTLFSLICVTFFLSFSFVEKRDLNLIVYIYIDKI